MRDGVLVRRWESADGTTIRRQVILPRAMIGEVFRETHAGGDLGLTRTLGRIIRLKYYWVGIAADLRSHLRQCDVCARRMCPSTTSPASTEDKWIADGKRLDVVGPFPAPAWQECTRRFGRSSGLPAGDRSNTMMEEPAQLSLRCANTCGCGERCERGERAPNSRTIFGCD